MAICSWCDDDMTHSISCTTTVLHEFGAEVPMIPFGSERPRWRGARCGDCGTPRGGFHHPGCDVQQCPVCFGQMLSCGCRFDEDGVGDVGVDANGDLFEVVTVGHDEVVVRHTNLPASDVTTVRGVRVTTPVRTLLDIAVELDDEQLDDVVEQFIDRGLLTAAGVRQRAALLDMRRRPGTHRVLEAIQWYEDV